MTVNAPADKRFRRAHLKPARKRTALRVWRWRVMATGVLACLAFYAAHRAVGIVAGLTMFHVEQIVIRGNQRLSNGEVLALLHGLRGRSILSVDLEEWRRTVLNSPWVSDAVLRRTLPSTVDVTIQEREPLGIGRINGMLYLVDDRGAVIDEYGPSYADLDLPIIDGLSSVPGDETSDVYRAMLARRLLDALRVRNMVGQISQIDVSDARNAVVLLEGDPTLIRLGNERFVERLQSYFEIAPALRERVPVMDYVDLRFDERVYVRPSPFDESSGRPEQGRGMQEATPPPDRAKSAPAKGAKGTQTG
ncbi:MAG: FtsQ-type POTRA domain-containing protein [Acidobacteria bacterium]|nr:FtsQ-type POTRA domain-containing protein [Acidobacteriota bacterium]